MNIIYSIGIYMLVSSVVMVSYVWFRYVKHTRSSNYNQTTESKSFIEEIHFTEELMVA